MAAPHGAWLDSTGNVCRGFARSRHEVLLWMPECRGRQKSLLAKFAKFCACFSAPCNILFLHVRLSFFLMNDIPPESAEVECSFSLAGYADNKYRHTLPNDTRRLTNMLLFNGDLEGRFATP